MMEISTIKLITSVIAGVKFHRAGLSDLPNSFQELQNLGDASPDCSIFFAYWRQDFFYKHSVPNAQRTVQQSLENIHLNISWLSRDADRVRAWLQGKGY